MSSAANAKRIQKEILQLQKEDLGGIVLEPDEKNIHIWKGWLPGPSGTPYAGGMFEVEIQLPNNYPFSPPKLRFLTQVYHCNINQSGMICLDTLKNAWSPALSIHKIMLTLQSLLQDPNPKDPLDRGVAVMYMNDRKKHDEIAAQWTKQFAMGNANRQKRKQGEEASSSIQAASSGPSGSNESIELLSSGSFPASTSSTPRTPTPFANTSPRPIAGTSRASRTSASAEVVDVDADEEDEVEKRLQGEDGGVEGRRVRSRTEGTNRSEPIVID